MSKISPSAARVQEFLRDNGFQYEVLELRESTRTAQEAANSVGCTVSQIAKSLVFKEKTTNTPILIIAAGSNRVNTKKVERATGMKLGRADGNYVKDAVGFAIGGVPPAGHLRPLTTILDPDLKKHETIWAAAGSPQALFEMPSADLERLTGGKWIELAE